MGPAQVKPVEICLLWLYDLCTVHGRDLVRELPAGAPVLDAGSGFTGPRFRLSDLQRQSHLRIDRQTSTGTQRRIELSRYYYSYSSHSITITEFIS